MSEQRPVLTLKRKTSDVTVTKAESIPEQKTEQPIDNTESKQESSTTKKPAKQKKPKEIMPLEEAIAQLHAVWPALFDNGQPRLLKIGIFAELCTDSQKNEHGVSNKKIRRCLESITRSEQYLAAQTTGSIRYDMNGQPAGEVSENASLFAENRLSKIKIHKS